MGDIKPSEYVAEMRFQVAYVGDPVSTRTMDVYQLAPALIGLGDLVREANAEFNGEKVKVNLLVSADIEHKSFDITFDLIQSAFDQIKSLIGHDDVTSAKEILEWLGLLGKYMGIPIITVMGYLGLKSGRKVESATALRDETKKGFVEIKFGGDHNTVEVHNHVYTLAENPRVKKAVSKVMSPVGTKQFDGIEFRRNDRTQVKYTAEEASHIVRSCEVSEEEDEVVEPPQEIVAHLRVYSPVYDKKADKWRFTYYGGQTIYADISGTTIANDALSRGGALAGDIYKVKMSITERVTPSGQYRNEYIIIEVLQFTPSPYQSELSFEEVDDDRKEEESKW